MRYEQLLINLIFFVNLIYVFFQKIDSVYFIHPVDTTEYPLYKNIIKKPMDFTKIKQKNDAAL